MGLAYANLMIERVESNVDVAGTLEDCVNEPGHIADLVDVNIRAYHHFLELWVRAIMRCKFCNTKSGNL